ncbi:MAG: hypothetical protein NVS1B14_05640 [Vulcanimicrobiaceae bacterium]
MKVSGIDATYYTVKDIKGLTKFYTDLLGQPPVASQDQFSEWVFADGGAFGLYRMSEGEPSAGGSVMFAVDDVAAAIAENKKRGVKFHDDDVTDTPVCQMAFGEDPEGNQFIFHKRKNTEASG